MEAHVNMRRCVTDGLDREIVVTIHRVLNLVEMFLPAGEFIGNQEILKVRLVSPGSLYPMCNEVAAILLGR